MAEENNVCNECGYEGPEGPGEGMCPECGGEMIPSEEPEEKGTEDLEEEEF